MEFLGGTIKNLKPKNMHFFTQHLWTYPREVTKDVCCNDSAAEMFTKIMLKEWKTGSNENISQ